MQGELTTILLGAGASRAVSYRSKQPLRSPLDADFFELLQKLEPQSHDETAVSDVIQLALSYSGDPIWKSMERMFYSLYNHARMSEVLFPAKHLKYSSTRIVDDFTRAITALLRAAHGKRHCEHHIALLRVVGPGDGVVTFNYDLVVERALKKLQSKSNFGPWIYGFEQKPENAASTPIIHKLHGSMNWVYEENHKAFAVRQKSWADFDEKPGYRAHAPKAFPIMLPYWDKKIEAEPWTQIWQRAAQQLSATSRLIVWGYSMPITDLKALDLLRLSLRRDERRLHDLCVIDPSAEVRTRWRSIFPKQRFWPYDSIEDFLDAPPVWWSR